MFQSGPRDCRITVAGEFSPLWAQTPPSCISAATKVVLKQRLQSLLLLSPGWIQSSAGGQYCTLFWKENTDFSKNQLPVECVLYSGLSYFWETYLSLTVEKQSIKQPRPAKPGDQPRLKDDPVDVIPEEPCRTEVGTQVEEWYLTFYTVCIHYYYVHVVD